MAQDSVMPQPLQVGQLVKVHPTDVDEFYYGKVVYVHSKFIEIKYNDSKVGRIFVYDKECKSWKSGFLYYNINIVQ